MNRLIKNKEWNGKIKKENDLYFVTTLVNE